MAGARQVTQAEATATEIARVNFRPWPDVTTGQSLREYHRQGQPIDLLVAETVATTASADARAQFATQHVV